MISDDTRAHLERLKAEAIAEARAELGPEPPDDGHAAAILRRARREAGRTQPYLKRETHTQQEGA